MAVDTLYQVSIQIASYPEDVVNVASHYLEGETEDYFFFQYDASRFVLLVGDLDIGESYCRADSCRVYEITRDCMIVPHTNYISAPINGIMAGPNGGAFTADISFRLYDRWDYNISYLFDAYTGYDVLVETNGLLAYSSYEDFPHLIEGGQNYAFAAFVVAFICIAFKLGTRIFSRCH